MIRCWNCQRTTDDPARDGFSVWRDLAGEGEHLFCRLCSVAPSLSEYGGDSKTLIEGARTFMATKVALRLPREAEVSEVSLHLALVQMKYMRVRALFDGIGLLLRGGLYTEAMTLARSLYETSLRLIDVSSRDDWPGVVCQWYMDGIEAYRRAAREGERIGERTEEETAQDLARLDLAAESIQHYVVRLDLGPLKRFPNTQQLADRHERNNDYLNYLMGHETVHGGPGALLLRTEKTDDVLKGFQRGGDPDLAVAVAAFAIRSYVHAHVAMAHLAGWAAPPEATALIADADRLDELVEARQGMDVNTQRISPRPQ